MDVKNACLKKIPSLREAVVPCAPVRVWCSAHQIIIVHNTAVLQRSSGNEDDLEDETHILYSVRSGTARLVSAELLDGTAYLLVGTGTSSSLLQLQLPSTEPTVQFDTNGTEPTVLYDTEGPVDWFLPLLGENIRTEFFVENDLPEHGLQTDTFIVVWSREPVVLWRNKKYFLKSHLSRRLTKTSFYLTYVESSADEKKNGGMDLQSKFMDLAELLPKHKKLKGELIEAEIKDLQLFQNKLVVLLSNGELWLYTASSRSLIINKIDQFTLNNGVLTALTVDHRLYTGNLKDLPGRVLSTLQEDDALLRDVFSVSMKIQETGKDIKAERIKLEQLKLFSRFTEQQQFLNLKLKVETEDLRPSSGPILRLQFNLLNPYDVIEDGFFALRLSLRMQSRKVEKTLHIKQMRFRQSVFTELGLPELDLPDFPLVLTGHLLLLEDKISVISANFLMSAPVHQQELSPFLFLKPRMDHVDLRTPVNDVSARVRFLSLLDCREDDCTRERRSKKKLRLNSQLLENTPISVLTDLMKNPAEPVLFSFLDKEIILECCGSGLDAGTVVTLSGYMAVLSVFINYLSKHYV